LLIFKFVGGDLMDNEYYNSLPKKRMAAGALILNERNELLIVKPT
jgi:hypothetical protein